MKIRIFTKKKNSVSQVFMKIIYEIFSLVCHCQDFHQRPNFQLCKKKKEEG